MKANSLTSLLLLLVITSRAQIVAIQNNSDNKLMLCMGNSLTVAVENLPSDAITLSTNNGRITQDTDRGAGNYFYHADSVGRTVIYVKKRMKGAPDIIIDSTYYTVHRMPASIPRFAGKSSGHLSQSMILAQMGLVVAVECCGFDARFPVNSYTVAIYRKGKNIFKHEIQGAVVDQKTKDFFHTLQNEDGLQFSNIKIKDCDGALRPVQSIEFMVKDAHTYKRIKNPDPNRLIEDPITGETVEMKADSVWSEER